MKWMVGEWRKSRGDKGRSRREGGGEGGKGQVVKDKGGSKWSGVEDGERGEEDGIKGERGERRGGGTGDKGGR